MNQDPNVDQEARHDALVFKAAVVAACIGGAMFLIWCGILLN